MDVREIAEKIRELSAAGEDIYLCLSCDSAYAPDEAPPLRECSSDTCGCVFVSEDRNCEDCNRPFTRKEADHACPDCQEECELL